MQDDDELNIKPSLISEQVALTPRREVYQNQDTDRQMSPREEQAIVQKPDHDVIMN
jgi:hypothetical protein